MTSQLRILSLQRVIAGLIAIACFVQAGRFFLSPQLSSSVEASVAAPRAAALPRYVPVPIEEIREGDYVLTRDGQTGEFTSKPVVQSFRRTSDHLRQVEVRTPGGETATIETTNEHPFWVAGQGWTNAADLQPDDTVTDETGQAVLVAATTYTPHDEGVAVFNFEVADTHSYYVQAPNARGPPVWVHNANCGPELYQLDDFRINSSHEIIVHPFSGGGSHITTSENLAYFRSRGSKTYGGGNGLFLSPKSEVDSLLKSAASRHKIEISLGLRKGSLEGGNLIRIDVDDPFSRGLRLPTGGNEFHRPGVGLTTGNLHEGVITSPLIGTWGVRKSQVKGF